MSDAVNVNNKAHSHNPRSRTGAWAPSSFSNEAERAEVDCLAAEGAKAAAEAARVERRTNFMVVTVGGFLDKGLC